MQTTLEIQAYSEGGSVTVNLTALKRGDSKAQEWIFAHLLPQALIQARKRIGTRSNRYHDEYEIAVEVLGVLLMRANTFGGLKNRSDLYRLLRKLVKHKAVDAYRRMQSRQKFEVGESWFGIGIKGPRDFKCFSTAVASTEATSALAAELLDSMCESIRSLNDDQLQCREILKLLIEGYKVAEISQMVGRGERSIYRLLNRIKNHFLNSPDMLVR